MGGVCRGDSSTGATANGLVIGGAELQLLLASNLKWKNKIIMHKRKRLLKNHAKIQKLAKDDPDSDDIFAQNLFENYYPERPADMEDVCLYDFVANYDFNSMNRRGERNYKKLKKPRLPNHKIFDPTKENECKDYYYSLLLLFVPFREEQSLLQDGVKVEEAFARHLPSNHNCVVYHEKLQKILAFQSHFKEINDIRQVVVEEAVEHERDPRVQGEVINAMHDVCDLNANSSLSLNDHESMLNGDQKRVMIL